MERQLRLYGTDLLVVAVGRNCDRAIRVAKLRRFQQRQCRDGFSSGKLKGFHNEGIVLVAANLDFVGIALAIVRELSLHVGCPDKRVKMSRSSNINLIVRDDSIELLLGFTQS